MLCAVFSAINFVQKYIYFFIWRKYFSLYFVNVKKILKLRLKFFLKNYFLYTQT